MNLELNVVRFENEDVIATSGVCAHLNAEDGGYGGHINISEINFSNFYPITGTEYYHIDGGFEKDGPYSYELSDNTFDKVDSLGWYHLENGVYEKCDPNAEHPFAD